MFYIYKSYKLCNRYGLINVIFVFYFTVVDVEPTQTLTTVKGKIIMAHP